MRASAAVLALIGSGLAPFHPLANEIPGCGLLALAFTALILGAWLERKHEQNRHVEAQEIIAKAQEAPMADVAEALKALNAQRRARDVGRPADRA